MFDNLSSLIKYILVGLVFFMPENGLEAMDHPKVVSDAYGNSIYVSLSETNSGNELQASYKPSFGVWSDPVTISDAFSYKTALKVKADAQGNFVVIWVGIDTAKETYSIYSNIWLTSRADWIGAHQISNVGKILDGDIFVMINEAKTQIIWSELDDDMKTKTYMKEAIGEAWNYASILNR